MASDSMTSGFGGDQLGRMNTPRFKGNSTEIINKPISSAYQAFEVFQRLQKDNQARANRNKLIADSYNGGSPFDQKKLDAAGEGWRANFSTLALATFCDRVTPRLVDAVHAMKYLTASELPDSFVNSTDKTDKFRTRTTELIRSWVGWIDHVEQVAGENVLFGYAAQIQMDEYEWRPTFYRQEDVLFDEQTPQIATKVPVFCVKANYYIHEAADIITDADAAEEAGYNVGNLQSAIEQAAPPYDSFVYNPRQLSDMVREGNLYYSFHRASKMIETAHVFCKCYDGTVDHWWVNRNGAKKSNKPTKGSSKAPPRPDPLGDEPRPPEQDPYELGYFENCAESMDDVITLFSFQPGNGRLMGSKGIGRLLYNICLSLEKTRMAYIDAMWMAGMLIGQCEEAILGRIQPHIRSPFLVIPEGFSLIHQPQFRVDGQAWAMLDMRQQNTAEIIAGAFLPSPPVVNNNGQAIQTATAEVQDANKEEEVKEGTLARWWTQFTRGVSGIQRRIYSRTNLRAAMRWRKARLKASDAGLTMISKELYEAMVSVDSDTDEQFTPAPDLGQADADAVQTILDLLDDGLSIQEIIILANKPATEFTQHTGRDDDMLFLQFYQLAKGNPNYDQSKLDEMAGNRMVGFKVTKEIFVPQPAQTSDIEAQRAQQMEWATMLGSGIGVQVSQRDPHMQHFQTLVPAVADHLRIADSMPPLQVPKDLLNGCKLGVTHAEAHLQAMLQQGANKRQLRPQILQQKDLEKMYGELNNKVMQGEMQAAQMQAMGSQGLGALATPQAPPQQGIVGPMGIPMGHQPAMPSLNGNGAGLPGGLGQ